MRKKFSLYYWLEKYLAQNHQVERKWAQVQKLRSEPKNRAHTNFMRDNTGHNNTFIKTSFIRSNVSYGYTVIMTNYNMTNIEMTDRVTASCLVIPDPRCA